MTKQEMAIRDACNKAVVYLTKDGASTITGPQTALGVVLGISQQVVSAWVKRGYVSFERAKQIEATLGVPAKDLINPEIAELFAD